jgi:hypothetical protein
MWASILETLEEHLSRKPLERMYWWSSRRWSSVVTLIPVLTATNPLWRRSEEELSTLYLFGKPPDELRQEIQHYWQRPKWQQWLLRVFGTIDKKITVWFYYQKCLALREVQKRITDHERVVVSPLTLSPASQAVLGNLEHWLNQEGVRFARYLERQCQKGVWVDERFEPAVRHYQQQRHRAFLQKLYVALPKLPERERIAAKLQAKRSYHGIENTLKDYLAMWHHNVFRPYRAVTPSATPAAAVTSLQERRLVIYPGPSSATPPVVSQEAVTAKGSGSKSLSAVGDAERWFKFRRQEIEEILATGEGKEETIHGLLQSTLNDLKAVVEPQIRCYRQMVREMPYLGAKHYRAALEFTVHLQSELIKLYKQAALLFHPDHYSDCLKYFKTDKLMRVWNHMFVSFRQQCDHSIEQLQQGQQELEIVYPKARQDMDRRLDALERAVKELQQSNQEMAEQAKAREETLKAEIDRARSEIDQVKVQGEKARAELEAQAKMREEKARADMEAQAKVREEKARAEINDLKAQISQIAQLVSGHAVAAAQEEEPSANEEETRSANFFKTK